MDKAREASTPERNRQRDSAILRNIDYCPTCHGRNERVLDQVTGRYHVTFPARCPNKDLCEQRILNLDFRRPRQ